MTIYLADYAVYQAGLTLAQLKTAGYRIINFKISHGVGQKSVATNLPGLIDQARQLGLEICTFHWLDSSASGRAQADHAWDRLRALGLLNGTGHICDCESDATEQIFKDYMSRMTQLLDRPVGLYTGDWWWTDPARKWNGSTQTPYLHAAPNQGYLTSYPGDTSTHWKAGYGGWPNLAIMQHRVGKVSDVPVSQSAIRDPAVWSALTGGVVDVPLAEDMITLTRDTAKAVGRQEGDQMSAATLLQLAVIHAQRSAASTVAGSRAFDAAVGSAAADRDQALAVLAAALAAATEDRLRAADEIADLAALLTDHPDAAGQLTGLSDRLRGEAG